METRESQREIKADLLALLGLAVGYRLFFLWAMPRVIDTADAVHYLETVQHLVAGDFFGYDPKIPVLYPVLCAITNLFVPDLEWACRVVSFLASVATLVPVYLLARRIQGRDAARIVGIAMAVWPWLADYGWRISTEATAVFLWFLAVYLFLRALEKGGVLLILSAFPFWALSLTRAEGLFVALAALPLGAIWLAQTTPRHVIRLFPFGTMLAILLGLGMLYNRALVGYTTANYRVGFILEEFDTLRFAETTVDTLTDVLPVMLGPVLLLFLGVGLFRVRTDRPALRSEILLLGFIISQWFVSLFVLSPAPRYLMAPIIGLTIWSAAGMVIVMQRADGLAWRQIIKSLPVTALLATMLLGTVQTLASEYMGHRPRQPREYKITGLWMRENLEPGLVFTRKPQLAWYAEMPSTGPAEEDTLDQAINRAREARARYIAVDERYATAAMRPLLDPANAPNVLELLYECDDIPESRVVLYRFLGEVSPLPAP